MKHASLFSGIGGFDVAARELGWTNLFNCEINPFCRRVLDYHFPEAEGYENIRHVDFTKWCGAVDVLSGGFPCQPFSTAGLRKGAEDDRYLWPEMLRAIEECQPRWIVGENVLGLLSITEPPREVTEEVQADLFGTGYAITKEVSEFVMHKIISNLALLGYETMVFVIPACSVGAPHRRDRIWVVATRENNRQKEMGIAIAEGVKGSSPLLVEEPSFWEHFPTVSPVCNEEDGLPRELDNISFSNWRRESVKAYGNAIVPEVAKILFRVIESIS